MDTAPPRQPVSRLRATFCFSLSCFVWLFLRVDEFDAPAVVQVLSDGMQGGDLLSFVCVPVSRCSRGSRFPAHTRVFVYIRVCRQNTFISSCLDHSCLKDVRECVLVNKSAAATHTHTYTPTYPRRLQRCP